MLMMIASNHQYASCLIAPTVNDEPASDYLSRHRMTSGFGQFHTDEAGKQNRKPYCEIGLREIRALVDNPQQVDKKRAQWIIPSSLPSRSFKRQQEEGLYWMLWADIDKDPPTLDELQEKLYCDILNGADYEIYTSRSAREDYQKSRVLIPLDQPLNGGDWIMCQKILNESLLAVGVAPDVKSEGCAQLCYLPNRGQFYASRSSREGVFFNPGEDWASMIAEKRQQKLLEDAVAQRRKIDSKSKCEARSNLKNDSLIDAFNAAYNVGDILIQAGYDQDGNSDRYRHPLSESGSFSASVRDGRVHTLSSNDPLYTGGSGGGAHDAFSAFAVLFHNNDHRKAIMDAGDNWLTIGGEPWNQAWYRRQAESLAVAENGRTQDQRVKASPPLFDAPGISIADVRDGTFSTRPLTERGNALRLLDLHGDSVRHVPETGRWITWKDGAWKWDVDGASIRDSASSLYRSIYSEVANGNFRHDDEAHLIAWARASQKLVTAKNAVAILSDMQEVRLPMSWIDNDPMLIGLDQARRIVDLRTGLVRPASKTDYITKSINVSEVGEAPKATRWLSFLNQIFDGDDELIDWLHRWCGYLLTGNTSEQFLIFCFGLGANGKSIFAETLKYIVGDYARAISVDTLCESTRQAGGASPDLADLIGARLVMSTETEDGRALAETLVKSLVSGDSISARPLYKDPIQFSPQFKLLMLGNHRPVIRGADHGIWRRIMLVPFNRTFSPEERDPLLLEKLKAEAPHILAWMVEGCKRWQIQRLTDIPRVVREQTDDYRAEQDVMGQWLQECTVAGGETNGNDLYESYKPWVMRNGFGAMSKGTMGRRLAERGFRKRFSNGKTIWLGISIAEPSSSYLPGSYAGASRGS